VISEKVVERALASCHPLTPQMKARLLAIFTAPASSETDVSAIRVGGRHRAEP
jgi:hypothetical protein